MEFNTYQKVARTTAIYDSWEKSFFEKHNDLSDELKDDIRNIFKMISLSYACLGLAGESGEVLGKVKKIIRDNNGIITYDNIEQLKGELGDVDWYLSEMASNLGLHRNDIAESNISKLLDRKDRGVLSGSGDNR